MDNNREVESNVKKWFLNGKTDKKEQKQEEKLVETRGAAPKKVIWLKQFKIVLNSTIGNYSKLLRNQRTSAII